MLGKTLLFPTKLRVFGNVKFGPLIRCVGNTAGCEPLINFELQR